MMEILIGFVCALVGLIFMALSRASANRHCRRYLGFLKPIASPPCKQSIVIDSDGRRA